MTIERGDPESLAWLVGPRGNAAATGGPVALPARPPRVEFIERSHQRSAALGLTRGENCALDPMVRGDLKLARERNRRLYAHAAPVMHMLFEQIVDTDSMIVLTDAQGTILHSVGDDDFLERADKVALAPGENWAEHAKGTNAIGTALFEEVPTLVHAQEHFMHANSFLTCSAAPIMDPRGNVLGVLDVTGDHRSYHQHTMGLVRMSARMIENHWLSDDYNNRLRLHFHRRVEFIGTLLEGILVVGPDGRIIGANRGALDQLAMSGAALRAHGLASLFGISAAAIYDHFRMPMSAPMQLALPNGHRVHVSARFDWPSRPIVAGLGLSGGRVVGDLAPSDAPASLALPAAPKPSTDSAGGLRIDGLQDLCSGDPQIDVLVQKIRRVLDRDIPLLVLGETGTGKELLARAIHCESKRSRMPFVAVNCAALSEGSIDAVLFGAGDGVFHGRRQGAAGRLLAARGGTLFLDDIEGMPAPTQALLLDALEARRATPRGGEKPVAADIALICATRRNLREMIVQGAFREDLYYRLNGLALRLPALRERSDLEAVAARILQAERPNDPPELSLPVRELFLHYHWPGNLRQLANVLRAAAMMSVGEPQITTAHLPDDFLEDAMRPAAPEAGPAASVVDPAAFGPGSADAAAPHAYAAARTSRATASAVPHNTLERAEIEFIRAALEAAGGNVSAASKQLGISRNTIYRKLRANPADRPS